MATALLVVVALVASPPGSWWFYGCVALFLVLVIAVSTVPPLHVLRRLVLLEPVVLGAALLNLFRPEGTERFATVMTRSTLSLLAMIVLAGTTPFDRMLKVLRRAKVPGLLLTVLALLYRYLFVLIDEAERMQRARMSRTTAPSRSRRWHILATLIGQMFVRSSERAERIFAAMTARGWQ
jgi:cobalt/nickel transport system permease protein